MISQYCTECLKFRNQHCKGKEGGEKIVEFFGNKTIVNPSFLNFCKSYEFDKRLMPKPTSAIGARIDSTDSDFETCPNKGGAKAVKHKRAAAKRKRVEVAVNIDAAEEVEVSENLKSADLDDLLI